MNNLIDSLVQSERKRKAIKYFINGIFVTLLFLSLFKLLLILNIQYIVSFSISWIISNLVAYTTTRKKIFKSKANTKIHIFREITRFYSARLFTYFINLFLLAFLVEHFKFDPFLINLIVGIFIVILNYYLSGIIMHKDKNEKAQN